LGNDQVPYIRYYSAGHLVAQSNAVSEKFFHAIWGSDSKYKSELIKLMMRFSQK
jgi:hypothetical protein